MEIKERIIEIIEIGEPQSLIQRENKSTTELIKTDILIEELNKQLKFKIMTTKEKLARETTLEIIKVILEEHNGYSHQQIEQEELAEYCEHFYLWDRIYKTVFKVL